MEVGAVKQAFNNEVILLKKKLNQAKIQIIHKLTRKAKQLTEKKAPDQLKEKLKRKAESAVKEVLIIKKVKARDIAKFIVTHKGELNTFLNKPQVDQDKACARLLLHKALQDKYKFIRGRFSNVPIRDLFMSRSERLKIKKEIKEKQKQKNKKKGMDNKVVNSEGDWNVEDVSKGDISKTSRVEDDGSVGDDDMDNVDDNENSISDVDSNGDSEDENELSNEDSESDEDFKIQDIEEETESKCEVEELNNKLNKPVLEVEPPLNINTKIDKEELVLKPKQFKKENVKEKKQKDINKHKNLNEKIQQRKFKKDSEEVVAQTKIVDPFFITSSGENYMSVVEPRAPDEFKEEHRQGNRKLRRAVMFGHVPNFKPRQNNNYNQNKFNNKNSNERNNNGNNFKSKFNDRPKSDERQNFSDKKGYNNEFNNKRGFNNRNDRADDKPEKLHPSWEAKKKKSGILPYEGKKIVFDES